jgi:hypothetical protein
LAGRFAPAFGSYLGGLLISYLVTPSPKYIVTISCRHICPRNSVNAVSPAVKMRGHHYTPFMNRESNCSHGPRGLELSLSEQVPPLANTSANKRRDARIKSE